MAGQGTILYFTDKLGVSSGYEPIFNGILYSKSVNIHPANILHTSVYKTIPKAAIHKGNQLALIGNEVCFDEIKAFVDAKIAILSPKVIVVSCPAVLMLLTNRNRNANTIDKTRGGVYFYRGIPAIVTYPISVVNRLQENNKSTVDSEITDYKVKLGGWILANDWQKIARFYTGRIRELPEFDYSVVRNEADAKVAVSYLNKCVLIGDDIETIGAGRTIHSCCGFAGMDKQGRVKTFVFPFYDKFAERGCYWSDAETMGKIWESVRQIRNNSAVKTFHNGAYDNSYGVRDRIPARNYFLDSLHMWHSIFPELLKRLDFVASIMLDNYQYWKMDIKGIEDKDETRADKTMEKYWRYNALDCYNTLFISLFLSDILLCKRKNPFQENYRSEFMQNLSGLKMSLRGINKDMKRVGEHAGRLEAQAEKALKRLRKITNDEAFNPQSPVQTAHLIYGILGAVPRDMKGRRQTARSKGFKPSSGDRAFKLIKTEHPLFSIYIDAIHDAKRPKKQLSNIIAMAYKLQTDQFRYSLSAAGTETWRYSGKSSNFWEGTNPQNITKELRDWLVAGEDELMFDVDYSQSDDYFIAFESQDENKMASVLSDQDTHAIHTAFFFHTVTYEDVIKGKKAHDPFIVHPTKGLRSITKRIGHGANFQMASGTLFVTMGKEAVIAAAIAEGHGKAYQWTERELIKFIGGYLTLYHKMYPGLRPWYADIATLLQRTRQATNAFGQTRKFLGDPTDSATLRELTAFYGQSGTAGNMNRVLDELNFGRIPERFRDGLNPHRKEEPMALDKQGAMKMRLQVHDSLVGTINYKTPGWKAALSNLLTVMERPVIIHGREFSVPANLEMGKRWGNSMKDIGKKDIMSLDSITLVNQTAGNDALGNKA